LRLANTEHTKELDIGIDPKLEFPTVHALAVRGCLKALPGDSGEFEAAGLVRATPRGFTLTDLGHRHHRALIEQERASLDIGLLSVIYDQFPAIARRVDTFAAPTHATNQTGRRRLVPELAEIVDDVEPILRRSAKLAPRFEDYIARLRDAELRLADGDLDYAFNSDTESIQTIMRELHEDYLQTLGRGYDQDDGGGEGLAPEAKRRSQRASPRGVPDLPPEGGRGSSARLASSSR
jgi:hypothetical protein